MGIYDYPDPGIDLSDRYEPRCDGCGQGSGCCECCKHCGAGPNEACEKWCRLDEAVAGMEPEE